VITIPPLRKRKEDIPSLADYYLKMYCRQFGKPKIKISKEVMDKLVAYDFPGNIRELRNIIERAVILCEGDALQPAHIKLSNNNRYEDRTSPEENVFDENNAGVLSDAGLDLEENERRLIRQALEKAGNNKSKAAALLNITWQALDRRMKKYGME
ncbi:MAG TPA: sigma-54-dependent Fis family transcriptional regulator, partial [Bacteroidetes bacterium]|nr:sigma-54-dependent Fis family transcriptional regulator [Bacteroidota bacterium]